MKDFQVPLSDLSTSRVNLALAERLEKAVFLLALAAIILAGCTAQTLTDAERLDRVERRQSLHRVERGAEKLADVLEGGW